jgi:hypothetical protein
MKNIIKENENLKIREDAIKIKEDDLQDTIQSIDNENTKTSFSLAFESLLIIQSFDFLTKKPLWLAISYSIFILFSIIIAFYNLFAKKVSTHTNVEDVFIRKNNNNNWDDYIDRKYMRISDAYKSAKELLNSKANLTRCTFILLGIALLIYLIGGIIWK